MKELLSFPNLTKAAAQAAFLVYKKKGEISAEWPGAVVFEVKNHTLFTGPFRLEGESTTRYVVSFRGTDEKRDWWTNFWVNKIPFPEVKGAKVHSGYFRALESFVGVWIPPWGEGEKPQLLFTGHSMGGAMATLAAAMARGCINCDLISFGSPKVGNAAFGDWLEERLEGRWIRYWLGDDAVPDLPKLGYSHRGTEHHLWEGGETTINPTWRQRRWRQLRTVRGFSDHSMEGYLKRIQV